MAENTAIEWTDHTFNPWVGCTRISPACDNCYAADWARRAGKPGLWEPGAERQRTSAENWRKPLKWNRDSAARVAAGGRRTRVFCASLADVFDNQVPPEWRADLWALIRATPDLDWQLLTKRPQNIADMLPSDWADGWPNVWLGATVEDQERADRNIPHLLAIPARVRFLSVEPLLGPVDLEPWLEWPEPAPEVSGESWGCQQCDAHCPKCPKRKAVHLYPEGPIGAHGCPEWILENRQTVDWVIVGGESGPQARPMHPDWVRAIRDQCAAAEVPFLLKQWGNWKPSYDRDRDDPDWQRCSEESRDPRGRWMNLAGGHGFHGQRVVWMTSDHKARNGRTLDGITHDAFPEPRP